MKLRNQLLKFAVPVVGALSLAGNSFATAAAQPDTTDSIAYLVAGIVTVVAMGVATYGIVVAAFVVRKTRAMAR